MRFTLLLILFVITKTFSQQENHKKAFMNAIMVQDSNKAIESFEKIKNKDSLKSDIHFYATLACND